MKKFILILVLFVYAFSAQAQSFNETKRAFISQDPKAAYRLFPTSNYWTFLKLDTRTGEIWQVHFDVEDGKSTGEVTLNYIPLSLKKEENKGRFTLYATDNMYNFILLDQVDGRTFQVQWSFESKNRGITEINSKGNE